MITDLRRSEITITARAGSGNPRYNQAFRRGWAEVRSLGVFGRGWAIGIIIFSAARALIAWPALSGYGVNPWVFLALDLATAPPYGIGQAVAVKVLRDESRPALDAVWWCLLVVVTFLAPYAYIFISSGSMPTNAYILVGLWMLVFGSLAVWRMVREVRKEA